MRLLLASQSPARLRVLRAAGLDPRVVVSHVDEPAVLRRLHEDGDPDACEQVVTLARAKAEAVAAQADGELVLGCDSMFAADGEVRGKPRDARDATLRLQAMRGHAGVLHTGHLLLDPASGRAAEGCAETTVHIGAMTDDEIDAYVATGEPLAVAGGFTIDGLGGWFVDGVDGDHTNVIGVSLPLLRHLFTDLGVSIADQLPKEGS